MDRNMKISLIGKRFGRWTVMSFAYTKKNNSYFYCKCDCGTERICMGGHLKKGNSKSCGCLWKEIVQKKFTTHGMSGSKFYMTWARMKSRCYNKKIPDYIHYGGRGIKVCLEWFKFENFKRDMYSSFLSHFRKFGSFDTTLERVNVNGCYNKDNCIWATQKIQANNRR